MLALEQPPGMMIPMEAGDRERWDAKYRARLGHELKAPDGFVMEALDELGPGAGRRALDLAAGSGRHALELARRGWQTTAWDVSGAGLLLLEGHAQRAGLALETRRVDVLRTGPRCEPFDLLLCSDFLDRELWQKCALCVQPGGYVLLVTFSMDWPGSKPPERFRLHPGELLAGLPGLKTLRLYERAGRAGLLGQSRA